MKKFLGSLFFFLFLVESLVAFEGYHKWVGVIAQQSGYDDQKILHTLQYKDLVKMIKKWEKKDYFVSELFDPGGLE